MCWGDGPLPGPALPATRRGGGAVCTRQPPQPQSAKGGGASCFLRAPFFGKHTGSCAPRVLPASPQSPCHTPRHRGAERSTNSEKRHCPKHRDIQPSSPSHKPTRRPISHVRSSSAMSRGPGPPGLLPAQGGILLTSEPGALRTDPTAPNKGATPFYRWVNRGPRLHCLLADGVHITPHAQSRWV